MIDINAWELGQFEVLTELELDPLNVRIQDSRERNQADLLQYLFETEKVLPLVADIAAIGFIPLEPLIAVRRQDQLVVVEGNRRLAALQAMNNPYLTPAYRSKIEKLLAQPTAISPPQRVPIRIAPSQEEANQLVAALHTGPPRLQWTPTRRSAFFQNQLDSGLSVADLKRLYPTADIDTYLTRQSMLNLLREVRYDDPDDQKYMNSASIPVTTLERLWENSEFREIAGIRLSGSGGVYSADSHSPKFTAISNQVAKDLRTRAIDTRILGKHTAKSYQDYLHLLEALISSEGSLSADLAQHGNIHPEAQGTASPSPNGASDPGASIEPNDLISPQDPTTAESKAAPDKPKSTSSNKLDTTGLVPLANYPAISDILSELGRIDTLRFPNAAYDLLRTFLEKTIKAYADMAGSPIRRKRDTQRYIQFSDCLNWLQQKLDAEGMDALSQTIDFIKSDEDFYQQPGGQIHLNAANHNYEVSISPLQVQQAWKNMYGLIRYMLK